MKGVSPVIAVVLLIAIAVIAAVAVWYWVGPLTSKPPGTETPTKSLTVVQCRATPAGASATVDVRNTGGTTVTARMLQIRYNDNGTQVNGSINYSQYAYLNISPDLASGDSITAEVMGCSVASPTPTSCPLKNYSNLTTSVEFVLRGGTGIADVQFTC